MSRIRFDTDYPQVGTVTITSESSAYEEVDGVMLATRSSVDIPGLFTIETTYTAVELNGEVDHSIFEKP